MKLVTTSWTYSINYYYCIVNIAAKLQSVRSPETGINQPFSQRQKPKKVKWIVSRGVFKNQVEGWGGGAKSNMGKGEGGFGMVCGL